jgi:transcriptional pleiotropic regulator of transition state genes
MKRTGIIRRVDDLGRIVIPKQVRRIMDFKDDEPLEIFPDPEKCCVILKKYNVAKTLTELVAALSRAVCNDSPRNKDAILEKLKEIRALLKGGAE